jgi:hypothetical protein
VRLPAEEAVGIIPLFGRIKIQTIEPALLRVGCGRVLEPAEKRSRASNPHVRQQARRQETDTAIGSSEITLRFVLELPGRKLGEDDTRFDTLSCSENAVGHPPGRYPPAAYLLQTTQNLR